LAQINNPPKQRVNKDLNSSLLMQDFSRYPEYTFRQLMRDLSTDVSRESDGMLKGCGVLFPETLFIVDGKFDCLISLDKECCLTVDSKIQTNSLNSAAIKIKLQEAARERRLDTVEYGMTRSIQSKKTPDDCHTDLEIK
jgi:hypothetical protein